MAKTTDWFIETATNLHKGVYSYAKSIYTGTNNPVTVTCQHHGDFITTPSVHIHQRQGCIKCPNVKTQQQAENLVGRNIIVDLSQTVRTGKKIEFLCGICGKTWQAKLNDVLRGNNGKGTGCIHCEAQKPSYRLLTACDITERLPDPFIRLLTPYTGMNKKHTWCCDRCDTEWQATPSKIIYSKTNCPNCFSRNYSHMAVEWIKSIETTTGYNIQYFSNGGEYVLPGTSYRVDGYCKETNTIYEFHGDVFHGNPDRYLPTDKCHPYNRSVTAGELYAKTKKREELILSLGYNLVTMWEKDYLTKRPVNQSA